MANITNADVAGEPNALKAQLAFLTWVKDKYPSVYSASIGGETESGQLNGIFDTITSAIGKIDFAKLGDGVMKAGTGLLALKSQKDLLALNLKRAKAGQPPIDVNEYGQAPTIRTQIDLQPELAQSLKDNFTNSLPIIAIAGLGLLLFLKLRRR